MSDGIPTIYCFQVIFANIVSAITTLALLALFIMILLGGFHYLTAGGDPKKVESARGTLTMAFLGFIIIMGAYLIIAILAGFFGEPLGESLKNFRIYFPGITN